MLNSTKCPMAAETFALMRWKVLDARKKKYSDKWKEIGLKL